ncbi:MAG: hypothetical protein IPP15_06845 [Saprospiraceae bacterium]|uniref:Uncharacterized protein n=1 Tax=Candidatus Opimibacter skivensis TaxID=2982028 RepID=A0A9D7SUJ6_9BACT|nr:hypothetical protein [Candidatus Opimibacter skivensis]
MMERRNFIQKSAVGLIGYNLVGSGKASTHIFQTSILREWLHQLVSATGASKRSGIFLPSVLSEAIDVVTRTFSDKGFKGHRSSIYFYGDHESYCLYAIEVHHERSGMTEMVLPVLHKEENGQWKHFTTINGYQLEALVLAADGLKGSDIDLQQLLLPTVLPANRVYYQSYTSSKERVDIRTNTYINRPAETSVSVYDGHKELFKNTFVSKHCLTTSSMEI